MIISNAFNKMLGVGLLLIPFIFRYSKSGTVRESRDSIFVLLVFSLLFLSRKLSGLPMKELCSILALGAFAFFNVDDYQLTAISYQTVMFISGLTYIGMITVNSYDLTDFILNCIVTASLIQFVWILANFAGLHPSNVFGYIFGYGRQFVNVPSVQATGSLLNIGLTGAHFALSIPAFFRGKLHYLAIIPLTGAILTGSSMAIASAVGVVLYYGWLKMNFNKYIPWMALLVSGIFYYFTSLGNSTLLSDTHRKVVWQTTMDLFMRSGDLLTGFGLGHFSIYFHKYFIINNYAFRSTHNEYIQMLYNFGIMGSVLILFWLFKAIKNQKNPIYLCGIFAMSINCYGNFMFHISPLVMISLYYWGMCLRKDYV